MMKLISCPVCGARKHRFLMQSKDRLLNKQETFTVVQCEECKQIFLNPQPSIALLSKYYPDNYPGNNNTNLKRIIKAKTVKDKILRLLFLMSRRPTIDALANIHDLNSQTKLLDIGCGNGSFLFLLKTLKSVTGEGIEISQEARVFIKENLRINVYPSILGKNKFSDTKFDIITMFEYFEHEVHPRQILKRVRRMIKNSGLLVIETPNIESPIFRIYRSSWFHLDTPRHVFLYSRDTLIRLLKKEGFVVEKVTYYPTASVITSSFYLFNIYNKIFSYAFKLPLFLSIFLLHLPIHLIESVFGSLLKILGTGDIMILYAKPNI